MTAWIISSLIGFVAGGAAGLLGIGGGILLTPLFVILLGMEQHRAQGLSLASLLPPVGLPALLQYRKNGIRIHPRVVGLLLVGFVGGSAAGAWLAHRIASRELRLGFVAFLIISAARTVQTALAERAAEGDSAPTQVDASRALLSLPIGLVAGVLSGLLGIGGAILLLPALERFVGLKRLEAQATTLALMLAPIGLPAMWVYAKQGSDLDVWQALAVILGFGIGAMLGGAKAARIQPRMARLFFAAVQILAAISLIAGR